MKFDCISKKLKEASIESITRGKKVEFKYDEFVGNNKKKYPILSTILVPDEDINLILRIEKIDTNWDGNIDFVANNGYRRKVLK
jgi:Trp operon repressor